MFRESQTCAVFRYRPMRVGVSMQTIDCSAVSTKKFARACETLKINHEVAKVSPAQSFLMPRVFETSTFAVLRAFASSWLFLIACDRARQAGF
jgi:hypothetical protein